MKYLLPLLLCLLLATPVHAQDAGDSDSAYAQQDEAPAAEDDAGTDLSAGAVPEENQTDMEQLRNRAADYKAQLAEEMPSAEEMKEFADQHDIKAPTADQIREFGSKHQGKFNKALDYAKQFQEFRREQADEYESGALAPAE